MTITFTRPPPTNRLVQTTREPEGSGRFQRDLGAVVNEHRQETIVMLETRRLRTIAVDDPGDLCASSATMESPVAGWRSRVRSRQGVLSPGQSPFEYLIAQNPQPDSDTMGHRLPGSAGFQPAASSRKRRYEHRPRAPMPAAGTPGSATPGSATLASPPDRAGSCAQSGSGMEKACTWVQRWNTNS